MEDLRLSYTKTISVQTTIEQDGDVRFNISVNFDELRLIWQACRSYQAECQNQLKNAENLMNYELEQRAQDFSKAKEIGDQCFASRTMGWELKSNFNEFLKSKEQ